MFFIENRYKRDINRKYAPRMIDAHDDGKLRMLVEGDSWVSYPRIASGLFVDSNIADHLDDINDFDIMNISAPGDEAGQIMAGNQKDKLISFMSGIEFDIIFISMGGNDIVGNNDLRYVLKPLTDGDAPDKPESYLDEAAFEYKLQGITHDYRMLLDFVKRIFEYKIKHKMVHRKLVRPLVITHTYDRVIPADCPAEIGWIDVAGPWLFPTMERYKIPKEVRNELAAMLLGKFMEELQKLEKEVNSPNNVRFKVIDTFGCVGKDDWEDEIHPNTDGFKKVAQRICEQGILPEARRLYPERNYNFKLG